VKGGLSDLKKLYSVSLFFRLCPDQYDGSEKDQLQLISYMKEDMSMVNFGRNSCGV
jgi:hypothetical protein